MNEELLNKLKALIMKFYSLSMRDSNLTREILTMLGIHEIVDLEFAMNVYQKVERDAAMKMVEKYLPDLTSGDYHRWSKAKQELHEIYYPVASTDEEAIL
jgi:hypothetical protein